MSFEGKGEGEDEGEGLPGVLCTALSLVEFQDYVNAVFAPYLWLDVQVSEGTLTAFNSRLLVLRAPEGWKVKEKGREEKQEEGLYWSTLSRAVDDFFVQKGWMVNEPDESYPDWEKLLSL
jgi:hypothetical protein